MHRSILKAALLAAAAILIAAPMLTTPSDARSRKELVIDEQPGYVPTPEEELLPAEYRPQPVFFRSNEAPGTIVIHTDERFLYVVQGNGRAIRYGIGVGRDGFQWQGLLKGSRSPICRASWPAGRAIRSAPGRSISATPSIASTAPTSRVRSAMPYRQAASAWSIATSSTSMIAFRSVPRSS